MIIRGRVVDTCLFATTIGANVAFNLVVVRRLGEAGQYASYLADYSMAAFFVMISNAGLFPLWVMALKEASSATRPKKELSQAEVAGLAVIIGALGTILGVLISVIADFVGGSRPVSTSRMIISFITWAIFPMGICKSFCEAQLSSQGKETFVIACNTVVPLTGVISVGLLGSAIRVVHLPLIVIAGFALSIAGQLCVTLIGRCRPRVVDAGVHICWPSVDLAVKWWQKAVASSIFGIMPVIDTNVFGRMEPTWGVILNTLQRVVVAGGNVLAGGSHLRASRIFLTVPKEELKRWICREATIYLIATFAAGLLALWKRELLLHILFGAGHTTQQLRYTAQYAIMWSVGGTGVMLAAVLVWKGLVVLNHERWAICAGLVAGAGYLAAGVCSASIAGLGGIQMVGIAIWAGIAVAAWRRVLK